MWFDLDCDGIQDAGELGAVGVTVNLYKSDGTFLNSASTDANGHYVFYPGDAVATYYVEFILPSGYVFSPQDASGIPGIGGTNDSDADSSGITAQFTLDGSFAATDDVDAGLCKEPPPPDEQPGTGTPGYWKNHLDDWPVDEITIGCETYSKDDAVAIMTANEKQDKTYTMFGALVAAKLNVLIGNDDSCIADTIAAADDWMCANPLGSGVRGSSYEWKYNGNGQAIYEELDDYNNGGLCAPPMDS